MDDDGSEDGTGSFSRNVATVADGNCDVDDDNIDTGQTMTSAGFSR